MHQLTTLSRKHEITFLLCLLIVIASLGFTFYKFFQRPTLNHTGFAQVQKGMSLAEVESLMGGPEGRYGKGPWMARNELGISIGGWTVTRTWEDHKSYYEVYFDGSDHVVAKLQPNSNNEYAKENSWWDVKRDYLGWAWRRNQAGTC